MDAGPVASDDGESDEASDYPQMPVGPCTFQHRELHPDCAFPFVAVVARPVNKTEARGNAAAQAALAKEWDRLRAVGCWDESRVRAWDDVAADARKTGKKAHVGLVFEIWVEKGSELPKGTPVANTKGE